MRPRSFPARGGAARASCAEGQDHPRQSAPREALTEQRQVRRSPDTSLEVVAELVAGVIERGRVAWVKEVGTDVAELLQRAVAAAQDRRTVPQRVEHGEAETLVEGRIDRQRRLPVEPAQALVGDFAKEL